MNEFNSEFLLNLLDSFAPSGYEDSVRNIIAKTILPYVTSLKIDGIGNLIATIGNEKVLLITAHMDEVGFMISGIREDGKLRFNQVGGVSPANLPSKRVLIGENSVLGVIGSTPVHLNKNKENKIQYSDLMIDIGAENKEEAEKVVSIGDFVCFETKSDFNPYNQTVTGKALDNRLGCYILTELITSETLKNGTFVFTVQEETGLRGATAILENNRFPVGIALDTTTANDLPGISPENSVCCLGKGAVISFADGATVYNRDKIRALTKRLDEKKIPWQTKTKRTGGNEASAIEKRGQGAYAISVSTPCRYIHGPLGMVRLNDLKATMDAVAEIVGILEEEKDA